MARGLYFYERLFQMFTNNSKSVYQKTSRFETHLAYLLSFLNSVFYFRYWNLEWFVSPYHISKYEESIFKPYKVW